MDLDVSIEDDGRSFFTPTLAETVFDDELIRIAIKGTISGESFFDKARESLITRASFADFYSEDRHRNIIEIEERRANEI